ncbi:MAG: hypothetical protein QM713_01225 [Arachnia sp.]
MKRALVALAAVVSAALALTGCGGTKPAPTTPASQPATSAAAAPADTRDFYIVGNGAGPLLKESNWGAVVSDAHKLQKSETANEYTITLDLYAADEFQFAIDSKWTDQKGAGYLKETEADGEAYFEDSEGAGLSSDPKKANIKVLKDGNFTLTLTTDPSNPDADSIAWVRNGDAAAAIDYAKLEMYIKGNLITEWQHSKDDEFKMKSFKNGAFTYEHEFFAGDEIAFYNFNEEGTGLGNIFVNASAIDAEASTDKVDLEGSAKGNIRLKEDGTYFFEYDARSNKLVVTYDPAFSLTYKPKKDWFIVGSGASKLMLTSGWGKSGGFEKIADDYRLASTGKDNEYSITLDLAKGDQFAIATNPLWGLVHGFSFIDTPEKDGTVYFTPSENVRVAEAGNYTLTLVLDPKTFTGDKIEWVRNGDMKEKANGPFDLFIKAAGKGWELSDAYPTKDGVVTFTQDLAKDEGFTFVYFASGVKTEDIGQTNPGSSILPQEKGTTGAANDSFDAQGNNFLAKEAGTYEITVDFNNGGPAVDFAKKS